jgi:AMMECR1 domain-containing protein
MISAVEDRSMVVSSETMTHLVRLARLELATLFGQLAEPVDDPDISWTGGFINVTLRCRGWLYGSMGAFSEDLRDATRNAVRKAAVDTRFGRTLVAADLGLTSIEIWIETDREKISLEAALGDGALCLGRDGLRLSLGDTHAYFKPSVAITQSVSSPKELLLRLFRKAGLDESALSSSDLHLERTTWCHVLESPEQSSGCIRLEMLRRYWNAEPQREDVLRAVSLCLRRMVATQKADGSLGYRYDSFRNRWSNSSSFLRLAGCAYALARASDHPLVQSQKTRDACDRLIRFLFRYACRVGSAMFIAEDNSVMEKGKLGTAALLALALQGSFSEPWQDTEDALVQYLIQSQNDDGSFQCCIGQASTDSSQNYYPGEALLALALHARRTGDERATAAVGRAFHYYENYFSEKPNLAFVVWQADAWSRIAEWMLSGSRLMFGSNFPEVDRILGFVFHQLDWLIAWQYTAGHNVPTQYVGGFTRPNVPTFSTAAFMEAIVRGADLAQSVHDLSRARAYAHAARTALKFSLLLQVPPELSPLLPRPELTVGGITASMESFLMRCDFDQHFVTACLVALESPILWQLTGCTSEEPR